MKRIFISHPYKDDPNGNKKRVDTICRGLAEKDDILPISPLHLFSFMKDDSNIEEILQVCFRLIDKIQNKSKHTQSNCKCAYDLCRYFKFYTR